MKNSKSKIGFTFPVLNNFKGAIEAICSIKTTHPYQVYIEEQWRAGKPLAKAWNDGFDRAVADGCEYVFICNDDILFSQTSVDNAIKEFERLSKQSPETVLVSLNNKLGEFADPYHILAEAEPYKAPESVADHPNYSCFMVRKDFFDKVGRFDENFVPAWCEDQDSHQRIHILGYRAICTVAASCVHFGGVSTALSSDTDSSKSRAYFIKKWGSQNPTPPQNYSHPYNDPNLSPKDWTAGYV